MTATATPDSDRDDDPVAPLCRLAAAALAARTPEELAETLASLATPGLVARAGGIGGLARALANPALGPLVAPLACELDPPEVRGHAARTRVRVRREDGNATFLASTVRGADRAWRLSGLSREEAGPA